MRYLLSINGTNKTNDRNIIVTKQNVMNVLLFDPNMDILM